MSATTRPVAQGGAMFSSARTPVSKETQALLKVMMNESKLTNFQQRQLKDTMSSGGTLPLSCNPTTSSPGRDRVRKTPSKKPRQPSKEGLRTKQTIEGMTSDEPEYRPTPSRYNSTKEKQKLQNVMAFGTDLEPSTVNPAHRAPSDTGDHKEKKVDRFEEILQEIADRKEFLEEMEKLGQGQKHRSKIMTEISQRVHELEVLDRQRCKEISPQLKTN